MLKLTLAVLAIAVAGTASAAGWRKLQIDASSEAAFTESVKMFQENLTPSRQLAFVRSLQDIWIQGTRLGEEQQREYTQADYFRQLDGLGYEEIVRLTDPTGKKADQYRAEYYAARPRAPSAAPAPGWQSPPPVPNGGVYRGATRAIDGGIRMDNAR